MHQEEDAVDRRLKNVTAVLSEHFENFAVIVEMPQGGAHAWCYSNRTWARGAMQTELERIQTQNFIRTHRGD